MRNPYANLRDQAVLITGAGSGLGEATARLFSSHGSIVGLLGRTEEDLRSLAEELESQGGKAEVLTADLRKPKELKEAIEKFGKEYGTIEAVFANAGINGLWAPIDELSLEEWDKTLEINLRGTFLTIKYATPYLRAKGGSIIVTSSVNGTRMFSNTGATAYSASKAGQVALVKMLAVELARDKIRVNVICPGRIESEIEENTSHQEEKVKFDVEFPEGNIPLTGHEPGRADQVADLVLFLASSASSHLTGAEIMIDGAQSLLQG